MLNLVKGYRTIGLIIISAILAILSRKGIISPDSGVTAGGLWDSMVANWESVASVVTSVLAIWYKLRAPKPGPLAPVS